MIKVVERNLDEIVRKGIEAARIAIKVTRTWEVCVVVTEDGEVLLLNENKAMSLEGCVVPVSYSNQDDGLTYMTDEEIAEDVVSQVNFWILQAQYVRGLKY